MCAMESEKRKTLENGDTMPFIEKFMVPQMYELFRFGGSSVNDDERGLRKMIKYFSEYLTEEQLRENMKRYNLKRMFDLIKKYFKRVLEECEEKIRKFYEKLVIRFK